MSEEDTWPKRSISSIEEIPNRWDSFGIAAKFTLECGHHCFMTGARVFNNTFIRCRTCALEGRNDELQSKS